MLVIVDLNGRIFFFFSLLMYCVILVGFLNVNYVYIFEKKYSWLLCIIFFFLLLGFGGGGRNGGSNFILVKMRFYCVIGIDLEFFM